MPLYPHFSGQWTGIPPTPLQARRIALGLRCHEVQRALRWSNYRLTAAERGDRPEWEAELWAYYVRVEGE